MDYRGLIKHKILEAKPAVEKAFNSNSESIYVAMKALLPEDDDEAKSIFDRVELGEKKSFQDEMEIFKDAFKRGIFSSSSSSGTSITSKVDDIISAALAFIALGYSKKDLYQLTVDLEKAKGDNLLRTYLDKILPININSSDFADLINSKEQKRIKVKEEIKYFQKAMQDIGLKGLSLSMELFNKIINMCQWSYKTEPFSVKSN